MQNNTFSFFSKGEIKPLGWIRRQLLIQAKGLSGNLDKVWPDVRDSKWIGGNRDGWERFPYWLDGFIPMAYLLDDQDMINKAKKYIDYIIEHQTEDGWLCPCTEQERYQYDLWSVFLIAKVLAQYADLSGDDRIAEVLYRQFENIDVFTRQTTIKDWAVMRWFEALIPLLWVYEKKPEDWLIRLAYRLEQHGFDYEKLFSPYLDTEPVRQWT